MPGIKTKVFMNITRYLYFIFQLYLVTYIELICKWNYSVIEFMSMVA